MSATAANIPPTNSKVININLTDSVLTSNKPWFTEESINMVKQANADIVTLQSVLPDSSTKDLLTLFHPEYEYTMSKATAQGYPSSAILWRSNKFRVKDVDPSTVTSNKKNMVGETGSLSMIHAWSMDNTGTSMTVVSWIPTVQRRGVESQKSGMLQSLLKFLSRLRKASNLKMRILVCAQFGMDMKSFNFKQFPPFKYYDTSKRSKRLFSSNSPFIFTFDSLRVSEIPEYFPVPNVFPILSNRNIKTLEVSSLRANENYFYERDVILSSSNDSDAKLTKAQPDAELDAKRNTAAKTIQRAMSWHMASKRVQEALKKSNANNGRLTSKEKKRQETLKKVMRAMHYSKLETNAREREAYQRYLERNAQKANKTDLLNVEEEEIFVLPGFKKKPTKSTSSFLSNSSYDGNTVTLSSKSRSETTESLPPIDPNRQAKEDLMIRHRLKMLSPNVDDNSLFKSSMPSPQMDHRKRLSDISPSATPRTHKPHPIA